MSKLHNKKIVVTGANSYVGVNLIKLCIKKKLHVVAFCRNQNLIKNIFKKNRYLSIHNYELSKEIDFDFSKIDTIFHLAHERKNNSKNNFKKDQNIIAIKNLISAISILKKINIVYLSSHLAYEGTLSDYGKSKFECEKILLKKNAIIIKAGFVFGGIPLGLFKNLLDQLRKIPIMPIIFSNAPIYPIHIDDLNKLIIDIALNKKNKKFVLKLGQKKSMKIKDFFKIIALRYLKKKIIFIPLPSKFIYQITLKLSYFSIFFNKIHERIAGIKSLSKINMEKSSLENEVNYLRNTNNFFLD
tara:strand:- start:1050 stop:1949 length:900 start_codon:yes stop_codon:yes gene_type:complete